jgi:diaminopimelate decarboxylase
VLLFLFNIFIEAAMDFFSYIKGQYHCEGVSLAALADKVGSPTYVYSLATLRHHARQVMDAFKAQDGEPEALVCYAVKANGNLAILKAFVDMGCGFDLVSAGELHKVMAAGGDPRLTVFAGVGKTDAEINDALKAGIYMFNIESLAEAAQINALAGRKGKKVKVDFRLNPDVDAHTHRHITTGKKGNKFGLPISQALAIWAKARSWKNLSVTGVHLHIGSQITQVKPFQLAIKRAVGTIRQLRAKGHCIETLNLGGGLGIIYDKETPASPAQFAAAVRPLVKGQGLRLILEPGRYLVGNAGVLLTRVTYLKQDGAKHFVIVDAAMNDLIRPSLYEAYHSILPVKQPKAGKRVLADVVGPICESGDFLAKDRMMALPPQGSLLAVRSAGAYGFAMSSNYNARPRAAEVLVDGKRWAVVRQRESFADLVKGETIPKWV